MNIELVTTDTASEPTKPLLERTRQKYGFLPNIHGILANSPLALNAYETLTDLVAAHASFTPREQQVIMLSASVENGCGYCVAAHTVVAGMVETPSDTIHAIRNGLPPEDSRLAALAEFTRIVVENRGWAPESDQKAFLEAGFSTTQALDLLTIVALKTISNYANHLGNPPLDDAFASAAWSNPNWEHQGVH